MTKEEPMSTDDRLDRTHGRPMDNGLLDFTIRTMQKYFDMGQPQQAYRVPIEWQKHGWQTAKVWEAYDKLHQDYITRQG